MKFRYVMVVALVALFFALALAAMLNAGGAAAQAPLSFGELEPAIKKLADERWDIFWPSLKGALRDELDGSTLVLVRDNFLARTGLDKLGTAQEKSEELLQIKGILERISDNPDVLMVDILANIQITPVVVEDPIDP